MIKLIIFDLDGTLLNSLEDLAASTNYVLKEYGYPLHPVEDYKFMVGNGIETLIEKALPESERRPEIIHRLEKKFMSYYGEHRAELTRPYEGIEDLICQLQLKGIALAVASNKENENVRSLVTEYFKEGTFPVVRGARSNFPLKPDPGVVVEILDYVNVKNEEALYVGDSGVDMQTARNAGVTSVGVTWGFRSREELQENGADYLIDEPGQLLEIVEKI